MEIENGKVPGGAFGALIALVRIVLTTSGPIALLAIALVVFQGYYIWERLGTIETNQATIIKAMAEASKAMSNFVTLNNAQNGQRIEQIKIQTNILRRICVSVTEGSKAFTSAVCYGDDIK